MKIRCSKSYFSEKKTIKLYSGGLRQSEAVGGQDKDGVDPALLRPACHG